MAGKSAKSKNRGPIEGFNVSGKMVSYHTIDGGDVSPGATSLVATGGVISDFEDPASPGTFYRVHTFDGSGNLVVTSNITTIPDGNQLEYLIIGGGGGSGNNQYSGGGGAGGFRTNMPGHPLSEANPVTASTTTYPIIVGGGGNRSALGAASTAFGYVAAGGGYGAGPTVASPGGSGGGGGWLGNGQPVTAGNGTPGQGNPGGTGGANSDPQTGEGGGGGAGGAGQAASAAPPTPGLWGRSGDGGIGTSINFDGNETWYCGGGGGSGHWGYTFSQGYGGRGGGGYGGLVFPAAPSDEGTNPGYYGQDGVKSTGGGGGGGGTPGGGTGGAGIIKVRYKINTSVFDQGVTKASGGTVYRDTTNSKIYHVFRESGTFVANQSITGAEILLVAGGGGGGYHATSYGSSGGGGAGGILHLASPATISAATYTITIGEGGAGGGAPLTPRAAQDGSQSQILCPPIGLSVTSAGGGGGGDQYTSSNGRDGGSGGGGGYVGNAPGSTTQSPNPSPLGTFTGYGNNGGAADPGLTTTPDFSYSAGGGGGAGAAGQSHTGGNGQPFPGFAHNFLPSADGYYGGGGGASGSWQYLFPASSGPSGRGGKGGGGNGADNAMSGNFFNPPLTGDGPHPGFVATPGVNGTGGGGGSGGASQQPSGPGGSGVCIISYPSA
jgi:hypothetical protein